MALFARTPAGALTDISRLGMEEFYPRTILELEDRFATEDACREYLMRLRWPEALSALVVSTRRMVGHAGPSNLSRLPSPGLCHSGNDFPGHSQALASLVSGDLAGHQSEERASA